MQRGFQLGLLLLVVQLFQEGLGNIPAVTLAVLGFNVYLYMFPAAPLLKACVSLQHVYKYKEWRRLFLSPLHHVDDWHLYFNMVSLLWKGIKLEPSLGAAWFLYLLSVFFLLTGLVYLLLQALLTKLTEDSDPLLGFIDVFSHSNECAVGFSGVLFALKVVGNHYNPGGVTYMLNIRVSNRFASWVELVLIYLINPGTSLVGHLAGILVGLLYTVGPLKTIMETCAEFVSSDVTIPRPSSYHSSSGASGYSGTRRGNSEEPRHAEDSTTDHTSDYTESYIAGLTEEEQIELAVRKSLNQRGQTGQRGTARPPHGSQPSDEELSPEELLRRRRLRRFEQGFSNQRRRRL
ncbi:rhomboid-related protein 4-like [Seriola aureovittata]|uniref:rhomboid-related protein 4-like n=1 Tax=Seriola aureovittata TaxID=2871759 RepID=UPI0024BEB356|nr:rhomboid-related protein 4-like [Seriola aureovittata]XP_056230327.1 rhomboid-related protein 4-like [Seriola aureovittata]